jgi:hypothetical protein
MCARIGRVPYEIAAPPILAAMQTLVTSPVTQRLTGLEAQGVAASVISIQEAEKNKEERGKIKYKGEKKKRMENRGEHDKERRPEMIGRL